MLTVFQVCFLVGVALIVLSLFFSTALDALGMEGLDLDIDFLGNSIFIPISPTLIILFLSVFGGVGWILTDYVIFFSVFFEVLIAVLSGLFVSIVIHLLVLRPLKKAQNTSTPDAKELVGLNAIVSETIFKDGFGEIRYVINGNSYVSPAKSTNGGEIIIGKDVAICWIEDYVFYVANMEDI
ncbi:MAG: NfeD-like [Anaerocolumna sp.]|nr:NfeD-like [Anaerocolumna sp.]